ncbi:MAG: uroporphyrinogen decarboxylase family protein [Anaerolineae bacterium]
MEQSDRQTIRWSLAIPPEVKCEYAQIPLGEYFTELEKAVQVESIYPERFAAVTGYCPPVHYSVPVIAYEGVAAMGGVLVFSRDHEPMIRNQGRVLTEEQVGRVTVPDPWQNERFLRHADWWRELESRFPSQVSKSIAGQEGPITTAGLLRGQDFFLDCLLEPQRAHRLLDVCTEMFILWTQASDQVCGIDRKTIGITDDYAGLIRPTMWPEFVIPYYRRIIAALGPQGCSMHTELVRREHLPYLAELNLTYVNFGEDQYLSIHDVFDALPGVPFGWHILTVAEMQQGTPESIRRRFLQIVEAGVTEVLCELTVDTPPENVRAFLAVAQELQGA